MANVIVNSETKRALKGRNAVPHIARKLSMPYTPEQRDALDKIDWGDYPDQSRGYAVRVNGKTVYQPQQKGKKETGPAFFQNRFKDDVVKGRWI